MKLSADAIEIIQGLSQSQKKISSKYFYDDNGDKIFQEIMKMPEYYLTNSEREIFIKKGANIASFIKDVHRDLSVIELGAGDGTKTMHLLRHLVETGINTKYFPVDISPDVLNTLTQNIPEDISHIETHPITSNFIDAVSLINKIKGPKLVLFIGSTIGNFELSFAKKLMFELSQNLKEKDILLLGADIKKDPLKIKLAYDDPHGITARFNMNLLERFNKEYGANFNTDNFYFYCNYNPLDGEVNSFLVSKKHQEVTFNKLSTSFSFKKGETIHTEISRKFDNPTIDQIFKDTRFKRSASFNDEHNYFQATLLSIQDIK